jgi:uncharacterized protein
MLLNLLPVLNGAKQTVQMTADLDFSSLTLADGTHPLTEPVRTVATARDISGGVQLELELHTQLHVNCARCNEPIVLPFDHQVQYLVVKELANEEDDDGEVIVLEGTELDVAEIVRCYILLQMEMQYLCKEDCKGLCDQCGANLNFQVCKCKKDRIDPRLAVLQKLLDGGDEG